MTTRDAHEPRTSHRSAQPRRRGSSPAAPPPLRLTARGAVLSVTLLSFSSSLLASATGYPVVSGAGFLFACALVSVLVRPSDLLALSVSPPLAYFAAVVGAEVLLALVHSGPARSAAVGVATRLADAAPWLFAGTLLVLVVATTRGLARNVRTLGDELNGRTRRGRRRP